MATVEFGYTLKKPKLRRKPGRPRKSKIKASDEAIRQNIAKEDQQLVKGEGFHPQKLHLEREAMSLYPHIHQMGLQVEAEVQVRLHRKMQVEVQMQVGLQGEGEEEDE
ncbi:hypothetical protein EJB05_24291, partial [Eragrostis curvula]